MEDLFERFVVLDDNTVDVLQLFQFDLIGIERARIGIVAEKQIKLAAEFGSPANGTKLVGTALV